MMKIWQLQSAKAKLSQLIQNAIKLGPQQISIRGIPRVVILKKEEYDRLAKKQISFVKFITQSPLSGSKINLKRDKSLIREDDL